MQHTREARVRAGLAQLARTRARRSCNTHPPLSRSPRSVLCSYTSYPAPTRTTRPGRPCRRTSWQRLPSKAKEQTHKGAQPVIEIGAISRLETHMRPQPVMEKHAISKRQYTDMSNTCHDCSTGHSQQLSGASPWAVGVVWQSDFEGENT